MKKIRGFFPIFLSNLSFQLLYNIGLFLKSIIDIDLRILILRKILYPIIINSPRRLDLYFLVVICGWIMWLVVICNLKLIFRGPFRFVS